MCYICDHLIPFRVSFIHIYRTHIKNICKIYKMNICLPFWCNDAQTVVNLKRVMNKIIQFLVLCARFIKYPRNPVRQNVCVVIARSRACAKETHSCTNCSVAAQSRTLNVCCCCRCAQCILSRTAPRLKNTHAMHTSSTRTGWICFFFLSLFPHIRKTCCAISGDRECVKKLHKSKHRGKKKHKHATQIVMHAINFYIAKYAI